MKTLLLNFLLTCLCIQAFAQSEMNVYSATGRGGVATTFVTDYQAAGINPANLGFGRTNDNKKFTLGLLELGGNVYHQGLSYKDFNKYFVNYKDVTLAEKQTAAEKFTQNTVSANFDALLVGLAIQTEKLGGLSISIRESFRYYSKLDAGTSNFIFRGATSSQFDSLSLSNGNTVINNPSNYGLYTSGGTTILEGIANNTFSFGNLIGNSSIKQHWYREYNVSYGRKVYDGKGLQLYTGVGVKYIAGYNYIDITADGQTAKGFVALNPLIDAADVLGVSSPSNPSSNRYGTAGNGYGFDLGATLSIKQRYKIGVSAVNIGSVTYNKNVYSIKDTLVKKVDYSNEEGFQAVGDIVSWRGENSLKVSLPAMLRAGASMSLLDYKMEIGIDAIMPLNQAAGNFKSVLVAAGLDYKLAKFLKVSTGFNIGGNTAQKLNIPLGIAFSIDKVFEIGIASRDVMSYFKKTGNSYSLAMGLVRWRI